MRKPRLTLLAAALGIILLPGAALHAQGVNLNSLAPNTVVGRLGAGQTGPAQAVPFATLAAQLQATGSITINGVTCAVGGSCTISTSGLTSGVSPISGGATNTILYEDGSSKFNNLSNVNSAVLVTSAGGVPSLSTTLPSALTIPNAALTGSPTGAGSIITINSTSCMLAGSCSITVPTIVGTTSITSGIVNGLLFTNSGNILGNLATANNGTLITSGGGVPSISSTLPAAVQGNITGTGTLTSGATGAGFTVALTTSTLTGAVPLANGGTNNTGFTPSAGGVVWTDATKMQVIAGTVTPGQCLLSANLAAPTWGSCSGAAAVSSVSNSDGTLTISPTTGAVIASLALSHANTWVGAQTFPTTGLILGNGAAGSGTTAFANANTGNSNFTLTFPAITANIAVLTGVNQTWTATNNFTSTFQISGNTMTFPGSTATLAALTVIDQTLSGGANLTPFNPSTGNYTVDCGRNPAQWITNGGAFTITAPANDGECILQVENNASAGAVSFSGFSEGANTGDSLDTTNAHSFQISITRIHSKSHYLITALQ